MKLVFYAGKTGGQKGKWRWRVVASNGRTVATGAEGYTTRKKAWLGWRLVVKAVKCGLPMEVQ